MRWSFHKYTGCGNDFILFDNRQLNFPLRGEVIRKLCNRRSGIGADGILLWEPSSGADAKMRIFNSDGSEAEMCGNGLRCFVRWLISKDLRFSTCSIEVNHRILSASLAEEGVSIDMGTPAHPQWNIPFAYEDQKLTLHHVDTGVPHTLLFVENIDTLDVQGIGSYIRHSWHPKGTNVTFAQQTGAQKLKVRTFERGVEAETPACGTGAAAAAIAASHLYHCASPIVIETFSKETLTVALLINEGRISRVTLTGPANDLFHGEIELPENVSIVYNSVL